MGGAGEGVRGWGESVRRGWEELGWGKRMGRER